ncbi:MAG: TIGR04141 family sporadically distributed protein [SAR324 cluster bacterium]|nr:TIGR04141 family sporadically distributed protein [SAR324 cluster bacterium]
MSEKWQVTIYKISDRDEKTEKVFKILEEELSDENRSEKQDIIKESFLVVQEEQFNSQQLENSSEENFDLFLFYRKAQKQHPNWKGFLKPFVADGTIITDEVESWNESFALFLYQRETKNLYVVTGGYSFLQIQLHADGDFGLEILSRKANSQDEKFLLKVKELGLTGGIVSVNKLFRNNYNLLENREFGHLYQEIEAVAKKPLLQDLGFKDTSKAICTAKNSFKIGRSISFGDMLSLVTKLDSIYKNETPRVTINEIKKISRIVRKNLVKNLDIALLEKLWEASGNLEIRKDLDFVHSDVDSFCSASQYMFNSTVFEERVHLLDGIYKSLKIKDKAKFFTRIQNADLCSYQEDGVELTKAPFLKHFFTEIAQNGATYFYVFGEWFEITQNFQKLLNESCNSFIPENPANELEIPWPNGMDEGVYNEKYLEEGANTTNTLVLDKVTPENIESCDILRWDDEKAYLYHVKSGFDASMRDLTSQIQIAATKIKDDIVNPNSNYLEKLYKRMNTNQICKKQKISKAKFLKIFKKKKLVFVLAVKDSAITERPISDVTNFDSNIAKFSLSELEKSMRALGETLKITQIKQS